MLRLGLITQSRPFLIEKRPKEEDGGSDEKIAKQRDFQLKTSLFTVVPFYDNSFLAVLKGDPNSLIVAAFLNTKKNLTSRPALVCCNLS